MAVVFTALYFCWSLKKKTTGTADELAKPGEGARDDGAYEDRVAHRFSIADVEGDEVLLGVVTGIQQQMLGGWDPQDLVGYVVIGSPLFLSYEVRPFGSFFWTTRS